MFYINTKKLLISGAVSLLSITMLSPAYTNELISNKINYSLLVEKDVSVIRQILNFLKPKPGNPFYIAIMYNPTEKQSQDDSIQLKNIINNGSKIHDLNIIAEAVSINNLKELKNYNAIIMGKDVSNYYSNIFQAVSEYKLISFTNDLKCVENSLCTLYIETNPSIEIVLNKSAAQKSSISFTSTIVMMVMEIEK